MGGSLAFETARATVDLGTAIEATQEQKALSMIAEEIDAAGLDRIVAFVLDESRPFATRSAAVAGLTRRDDAEAQAQVPVLMCTEGLNLQITLAAFDQFAVGRPELSSWLLLCEICRARPDQRLALLREVFFRAPRLDPGIAGVELMLETFSDTELSATFRGEALALLAGWKPAVAGQCVLHLMESGAW